MTAAVLDPRRAAIRLDQWDAAGMLTAGRQRTLRPGGVLHTRNAAALITRGLARLDADGTILTIVGDGDLLGAEPALLDLPLPDGHRATRVIALTAVTARMIPVGQLRDALDGNPAAMRAAAQGLYARMLRAEQRLSLAAAENAPRRLARLLCELERYGTTAGSPATCTILPFGFGQRDLAAWTGCCRETVGRALRDWRRRRIIDGPARNLRITDIEALARIAGLPPGRRPPAGGGFDRLAQRQEIIDRIRHGTAPRIAI